MIFPDYPTVEHGDGSLHFAVEPNTSGVERTGRIQVAETFLTIVQPALTADPPTASITVSRSPGAAR